MRGGDVDLGVEPLAGAAHRRHLERDDERVRDRGARLEAAGQRDHGDAVGASRIGELAAGRRDDPPARRGAPAASNTASVSSVLPE